MELSENKMGAIPIKQLIIHISWPMMLSVLLALLLLLSGCTSPKNLPTPSPADAGGPAPTVSASDSPIPSPIPEVLWWEGLTADNLPIEVEPVGNISSVDGPVCLALLPDADIGLYGDGDPTAGILLRKGDYLQFFPQTYATARYTEPQLNWTDIDGDKDSELIIKYLIGDTAGAIVYELHVYEWDGKAWTDNAFSQDCYQTLLKDIISYQYKDDYVNLVAGGSSTRGWYDGEETPKGLAPIGNLVFFRQEGNHYTVIFGLQLELSDGKTYDVATLSASLHYDGKDFLLKDYYLESVGGV